MTNTLIEPYKNRNVREKQEIDVYKNLTRNRWSIRDKRTQHVLAHAEGLYLRNATCYVRQTGNARVRETKRKNVHAFISGTCYQTPPTNPTNDEWLEITYNPYHHQQFIVKATGETIKKASYVYFDKNGRVWVKGIHQHALH